MNRLLTSAITLILISTTSIAATDKQPLEQINFVKKVYMMAVSDKYMGVDILKQNSSSELKQLLSRRDTIALRHKGEMCEWVRNVLIPGNDYDVRVNQMKFSALSNGLIRAQGKNFGESFQVDFKVQCDGKNCQIDDIYIPDSYKKEVMAIVKNNQC
ncbi:MULTISPECIES: hypothetical protein [Acinetobacter]|uniref:hypothetical protein n=1 Tax=Acinetobacter TaxID=469 RepID=UPI000E106CD3|nr:MULTISPECIES: hypothetical protein [Acinetobacter]AXJ90718.1 hypothetical protein DKP84_14295 [Acinetobacter pittii]HCH7477830.1 hypothetical protein [Acinetobacter baumannii]HCH7479467.1 hypothetical protein [Acinetobacter baumannii]